jgi:hypothetical protein
MDYVEFKLLYDALNLILVSNEPSRCLKRSSITRDNRF